MICSILQPHYLPWIGYFEMISRSDLFVFLDDVKFIKREWKNRNRIRSCATGDEPLWLTIPINKQAQEDNLCDLYVDEWVWLQKHLKIIEASYKKSPYFPKSSECLERLYSQIGPGLTLADINILLIKGLCQFIGIKGNFLRSSELSISGKREEKILRICESVGADTYLANNVSMNYLPVAEFSGKGIEVHPQDYQHPSYPQTYDGKMLTPVSYLSVVDLIMNVSREKLHETILMTG